MGRLLVRLFLSLIGGYAGAAAGSIVYQLRSNQAGIDGGSADITIAAPPVTGGIAALLGTVTGKRGPLYAFLVGAGITSAFGSALDEQVTGLATSQTRASATSSSQSSG